MRSSKRRRTQAELACYFKRTMDFIHELVPYYYFYFKIRRKPNNELVYTASN